MRAYESALGGTVTSNSPPTWSREVRESAGSHRKSVFSGTTSGPRGCFVQVPICDKGSVRALAPTDAWHMPKG